MSKVLATVGKVAGIVASVAILVGQPQIAAVAAAVAAPAEIATPIPERPMTAINLFADNRRAYLATDGAAYYPDSGRIAALGTKTLSLPSLHMAMAVAGTVGPQALLNALERVCTIGTQRAVLQALPAAFEKLRPAIGEGSARVWVASYDRIRAKPRLYAISSDVDPSRPDATPMQVQEIGGWTTGLTAAQLRDVLPAGYITNPREDSARLLSAQRHYRFPHLGERCGVGGTCEFYTVDRRGVSYDRFLQFPEGLGELPDPATPGVRITGQSGLMAA